MTQNTKTEVKALLTRDDIISLASEFGTARNNESYSSLKSETKQKYEFNSKEKVSAATAAKVFIENLNNITPETTNIPEVRITQMARKFMAAVAPLESSDVNTPKTMHVINRELSKLGIAPSRL